MPDHRPKSKTNIETAALNVATLVMIMEYLAPCDLLAVMHTCRMFYAAGIRPLVRKSHYVNTNTLPSYHTFMFSHAPASFSGLRDLQIEYWTRGDERTALLTDVLLRGDRSLRELDLRFDDMPDDVAQAVASLGSLHKLIIYSDSSEKTLLVLSQLRSPLTELSFSLPDDEDDPVLPLLTQFSHTLRSLTLNVTTLHNVDRCFSNLIFLDLEADHFPPLSVLMPTFPNLQELHLDCGNRDVEEQRSLRSQNIAFQQAGHTWTSLRRLEADVTSLSVMALLQDLDALKITSEDRRLGFYDLPTLQSILPATHPKSLDLSLEVEEETLQALLLSAGLERIADLSLNLTFNNVRHMGDVLAALLPALAQLSSRIRNLSLWFSHPYASTPGPLIKYPSHGISRYGTKCFARRSRRVHVFEGFEMGTFAGCVVDGLPRLERLSLRIEEEGDRYGWAAARWVSLAVEYDAGRAARSAVHASDDALRDVVMGSSTGTVYFSSPPRTVNMVM